MADLLYAYAGGENTPPSKSFEHGAPLNDDSRHPSPRQRHMRERHPGTAPSHGPTYAGPVRQKSTPLGDLKSFPQDPYMPSQQQFQQTQLPQQFPQTQLPQQFPQTQLPQQFPQTQLPQTQLPQSQLPQQFPQSQLPQSQLPQQFPQSQLPQSQLPQQFPQSQLPQSQLPQSQLPQSQFPQPQLPQSQLPQSQLPPMSYATPASYAMPAGSPHDDTRKASFDIIMCILVILVALSMHSMVEQWIGHYITSVDWSPEREMLIRLIYPAVIIALLWFVSR